MPVADADVLRQIADHLIGLPHSAALGLKLISVSRGRGCISAPWREDLVGDPDTGVIATGVVTALLDHTCGLAIQAAGSDMPRTATLDLRIDYMRPAHPRTGLIAEAHCYKITRSIAFVRAQAYDGSSDDPVATAQAAFMVTGTTS